MLVVDYIITAISLAHIVYLELMRCLHELINDYCRKLNDCPSFQIYKNAREIAQPSPMFMGLIVTKADFFKAAYFAP